MNNMALILVLWTSFLLGSDNLTSFLKDGSTIDIVKVKKPVNFEEDFDLAFNSFSKAFENCLKEDLIKHFGPKMDVIGFYGDLLLKDDLTPFFMDKLIWLRAFIGNKLIGWMSFSINDKKNDAFYVSTLVVDPEFQHLGVGKALLKSLKHFSSDIKEIVLLVRKINQNAIGFYEHLGFREDLSLSSYENSMWMSRPTF